MRAMVTSLIFLVVLNFGKCQENEEKRNILQTFLSQIERRPTEVVALLCWSKGAYLRLIKENRFVKINIVETWKEEFNVVWKNSNHVLYVLDIDCHGTKNLLINADKSRLLAAPFRWLILSDSDDEDQIKSHFESVKIYTDSDVTVALKNSSSSIHFIQIYKIKYLGPRIFTENIGKWDLETDDVTVVTQKVAAARRSNLHRAPLTASLVFTNNDSKNHLYDTKDKHIDSIAKLNYHLTVHLVDSINGTKRFTIVSSWGYKIKNTTQYSGMIGELLNETADLGGTALFITKERLPLIEYIAPTSQTNIHFIFRQPPLTSVTNVLVLPFSTSVWFVSLLLIIAIVPLFYGTVLWERKIYKKVYSGDQEYYNLNFFEIVLLSIAAICQQGSHVEPRSPSGRITMFFLFVILMFLYTAYSAYIVALIQSTSPNIRTLADLLHSPMKLGAHDIVYNRLYLPQLIYQDPIRRAIYEQKIAPPSGKPQFFDVNEGVRRIRQGLFAFNMEIGPGFKLISDTFLEHEKCGIQTIDIFNMVNPFYAIPKNSTFLEIVKIPLRKMHERGIQDRETKRFYNQKPVCTGHGNAFISVGLSDISAVVVIFFSGAGSAIGIFMMEFIYFKLKKKTEIKTQIKWFGTKISKQIIENSLKKI